jgi:molecular chaperone DnaK
MSKIVGIDLGTTNSLVASFENGHPIIISDIDGFRTTPSVVSYTRSGDCIVGRLAKRQSIVNPHNTFYSVKRFMGNSYDSVKEEVSQVAYQVSRDSNNLPRLQSPFTEQQFHPENLSAQILKKLIADAEQYYGEKVTKAVVAVPGYFNTFQREATRNAAKIAGLEVVRIINETSASALAYGLDLAKSETIVIFDLGGGKLDVSILEIGGGVFEILSICGDTHLGGDDFTKRIVDYVATEFYKAEEINIRQEQQALQRLIEASEQAKIDLSTLNETNINLPSIVVSNSGTKNIDVTLTRQVFEQLNRDLLSRCRASVCNALRSSKVSAKKIDQVILIGGSTRIPAVQELLKNIFDCPLNHSVNPDEAVALGAAIQAAISYGLVKDVLLLDVIPIALGIETVNGSMSNVIQCNTTIPTKKSETFSITGDNQTNVDIYILEGENNRAALNHRLGKIRIQGIPAVPKDVAKIEIIFDIDMDGVLRVEAFVRGLRNQVSIIQTSLGTSSIGSIASESLMTNIKLLELSLLEVSSEQKATIHQHIENLKIGIANFKCNDPYY